MNPEEMYETGYEFFEEQDYKSAVDWFTKAAEKGNADAQVLLGACYENGYGVGQSFIKAAEWYQKAANQGHATAKEALAQLKKVCKDHEASEAVTDDLFKVHFDIESGILFKYDGPGGDVVIPPGVTIIGEKAFYNCGTLTSLVIPPGVRNIGDLAFFCCKGLTSLILPSSVTAIGYAAFLGCTGIANMTIPTSVTSLGHWAFSGWKKDQTIHVADEAQSKQWEKEWDYGKAKIEFLAQKITSADALIQKIEAAAHGAAPLTTFTELAHELLAERVKEENKPAEIKKRLNDAQAVLLKAMGAALKK